MWPTGLLACALLVCLQACVQESQMTVRGAKILGYGLLLPKGTQYEVDANAVGGLVDVHESVTFTRISTNVPPVLGTTFGVEFVLIGDPTNAAVEVTLVKRFPEPGIKPPGVDEPILETRRKRKFRIGENSGVGYGFDEEWEIVSGVWVFEVWHKNRKLLEQAFLVNTSDDEVLKPSGGNVQPPTVLLGGDEPVR